MLSTWPTVLPVGVPSSLQHAYASNSRNRDQKGNGYQWKRQGTEGERDKEQTGNYYKHF